MPFFPRKAVFRWLSPKTITYLLQIYWNGIIKVLEKQFQWKQWLQAPYWLTFSCFFLILGIGGKFGICCLKIHSWPFPLFYFSTLWLSFIFFLIIISTGLLFNSHSPSILFNSRLFLYIAVALHLCYAVLSQSCLTLCDPMDCSTPGFPVLHYLPEYAQVHVHWVGDAIHPFCCFSVARSCLTLRNPMDCSMLGFSVLHYLLEINQAHVPWVGDAIQPYCPLYLLLLLPSMFPSIRVFSNELALCIRWPKYWSISLGISHSNEYSGLITFRIDWFDRIQSKGLSGIFSNTTAQKYHAI